MTLVEEVKIEGVKENYVVRALGFKGPRAADLERFHRIVAGEE